MDSSSHGVRTGAQSQLPPPPPPPEGTAHTPFVGTPPHRTDKPWTEVVTKGAMTPLTAGRTSLKPDHPFDTTNPFTPLCSTHKSTHDDLMDDGSGQSNDVLLTPADGDDTAAREFAVQEVIFRTSYYVHNSKILADVITIVWRVAKHKSVLRQNTFKTLLKSVVPKQEVFCKTHLCFQSVGHVC